jgi:hypothetical protein
MRDQQTHKKSARCRFIPVLFFSLLLAPSSHAAFYQIELDIGFNIQLTSGGSELPLNSTFYLIGSATTNTTTPAPFGDALIADSIGPDEYLIARLQLNWVDGTVEGEHSQTLFNVFVPDNIEFAYIRFFDYQDGLSVVGTNIAWGQSGTIVFSGFGNVVDLFFGDGEDGYQDMGNTVANQTNNFVVIPEPGTLNLILLAGAGILYLRRNLTKLKPGAGSATA